MVLLAPIEWVAATLFIVIQFIGSYVPISQREYRIGSRFVMGSPPGWVFGPIWLVLRLLRGFATFFYWKDAIPSTVYDWILALSIATLLLDYQWTPIFFGVKRAGLALIIVLLNVCTAVATVILMGVDQAWLSFGLLILYPLWLLYATYLNYSWWRMDLWAKIKQQVI